MYDVKSEKSGLKLREDENEHEEHEQHYKGPWWRFPPMRNALISGFLLAVGFILSYNGVAPHWIPIMLYIAAVLFGASHWGREAIEAIGKLRVTIDVLMAVATVGAAVMNLWEEAATLAFLYGGAEALEEYVYDRTRSAIRALLDLAPKEAHVLKDGRELTISATELAVRDFFLVRPGESIPTDGVINRGSTTLDESPVTGESVPVEKEKGAHVFAGTMNLTGAIEVEATRSFEDNSLSRIIHLVEEAQEQKTGAQRFIDKFGRYYSPGVLLGSLVLLVVPPLFGGDLWVWAQRAITLAVAGAPCALVMSTPVAVAATIGRAGKRGVLIKGGLFLERLGGVTTVVFDKTGTLTLGRPEVTDVVPLGGVSHDEILKLAAAVERFSEHPLARAIVRKAEIENIVTPEPEGFRALTGAGAFARVNGQVIHIGNLALFEELKADLTSVNSVLDRLQNEGKTVVLLGNDQKVVGLIALRDQVRSRAADALDSLRQMGVRRIVMLTGDTDQTAKAIGRELGITEVRARLKPEDKVKVVRELETGAEKVAMVGDGINDAPALAAASVGIAMGTGGTDAAIEAADVALMGDDLRGVVYALQTGRRAVGIMRQNITFSIILLAVLIPSAVAGILTIAWAVIAHEGAELLAVANGLRARA
jgi:heavy metal translocating P-type ATPase